MICLTGDGFGHCQITLWRRCLSHLDLLQNPPAVALALWDAPISEPLCDMCISTGVLAFSLIW